MTAPHTSLIVTVDLFHPASDAVSAQERALFAQASWGLMTSPEPLICRETALELVARAGAVEGIVVAYLSHGDRGLGALDLRAGRVDVRKAFAMEIHAAARWSKAVDPIAAALTQRIAAIMRAVKSGRLPAGRVVLVDRGLASASGRRHARNGLRRLTGKLHLFDPGPWGLTDGDYWQVCGALRIDPPLRGLPAPGQAADHFRPDGENDEPF